MNQRIIIIAGEFTGYEAKLLQQDKDGTWTAAVYLKDSTPWVFSLKESIDFLIIKNPA